MTPSMAMRANVGIATLLATGVGATANAAPPAQAAMSASLSRGGIPFQLIAIEWTASVSASESEATARAFAGELALPTNSDENALFALTLGSLPDPLGSSEPTCPLAWIGASHLPIASNAFAWRDVDNAPLRFSAFAIGTPVITPRIPLVATIAPDSGEWHANTSGPEAGSRCQRALFLVALPFDDCDEDGVPDDLALATGLAMDCNGDAVPDSCTSKGNIFGDIDRDGQVGAADLGVLLSNFGVGGDVADLNCDGAVNAMDLSILLANWS